MYAILNAVTTPTPRQEPTPEALRAIRAWVRLESAFEAARKEFVTKHGVTGEQVAIARIVAERSEWPMVQLRERMSMHPATVGQLIGRAQDKGLVEVRQDAADGRRRVVAVTDRGRELLAALPLTGPVRLRSVPADPAQLDALAQAFDQAVELFGLGPWAPAAHRHKEKS